MGILEAGPVDRLELGWTARAGAMWRQRFDRARWLRLGWLGSARTGRLRLAGARRLDRRATGAETRRLNGGATCAGSRRLDRRTTGANRLNGWTTRPGWLGSGRLGPWLLGLGRIGPRWRAIMLLLLGQRDVRRDDERDRKKQDCLFHGAFSAYGRRKLCPSCCPSNVFRAGCIGPPQPYLWRD